MPKLPRKVLKPLSVSNRYGCLAALDEEELDWKHEDSGDQVASVRLRKGEPKDSPDLSPGCVGVGVVVPAAGAGADGGVLGGGQKRGPTPRRRAAAAIAEECGEDPKSEPKEAARQRDGNGPGPDNRCDQVALVGKDKGGLDGRGDQVASARRKPRGGVRSRILTTVVAEPPQ